MHRSFGGAFLFTYIIFISKLQTIFERMYITLPEAKHHLLVDNFFTDDDQYIIGLIKVAEDAVAKRINRPLYTCLTIEGTLEPSVRQLILIMVGQLYNHREATTPLNVKEVPLSFEYLSDLNKEYKNF